MDESTFQKELSKYKVIRGADYYKVRTSNKIKTETKVQRNSISTSIPLNRDKIESKTTYNDNFWELISESNSSILTAAESIRFIEALRLVSIASTDPSLILNLNIFE
jgi:hypothetical protein